MRLLLAANNQATRRNEIIKSYLEHPSTGFKQQPICTNKNKIISKTACSRKDIQPDSHEVEIDFQVEQNDSIAAGFCILQCLDALYHLQFRNWGYQHWLSIYSNMDLLNDSFYDQSLMY
jgi:hypothetical protein